MRRNQSVEQLTMEKNYSSVNIWGRVKPAESGELSLFSSEEENGRSIVASRVPLKSRLVQTQYKNDSSIQRLNEIFPEKADVFFFDGVFS